MPARSLIVHMSPGVEPLWCNVCNLSTRRRMYAMTDRTIGVMFTYCPHCQTREKP